MISGRAVWDLDEASPSSGSALKEVEFPHSLFVLPGTPLLKESLDEEVFA